MPTDTHLVGPTRVVAPLFSFGEIDIIDGKVRGIRKNRD